MILNEIYWLSTKYDKLVKHKIDSHFHKQGVKNFIRNL